MRQGLTSRHIKPSFLPLQVGDFGGLVAMYVAEGNFRAAVAVLGDAAASPTAGLRRVETLIYRYGPLLFEHTPEATTGLLLRIGVGLVRRGAPPPAGRHAGLSMAGLLPAVLRYTALLDKQMALRRDHGHDHHVKAQARALDVDAEGRRTNFAVALLSEVHARIGAQAAPDPLVFQTLVWLLIKYHGDAGCGDDEKGVGGRWSEAALVRVLRPLCDRVLRLRREYLEQFLRKHAGGDGDDDDDGNDNDDDDDENNGGDWRDDLGDIQLTSTVGPASSATFVVANRSASSRASSSGPPLPRLLAAPVSDGDTVTPAGYDAVALCSARAHRAALARVLPGCDLDLLARDCLRRREALAAQRSSGAPQRAFLAKTRALLAVLCGVEEEAVRAAVDSDGYGDDDHGDDDDSGPALAFAKDVCRLLCGSDLPREQAQQRQPSPAGRRDASPSPADVDAVALGRSPPPMAVAAADRRRHDLWLVVAQCAMAKCSSPRVSKHAAQLALGLLADSGGALSIEDLLPLMPDFGEFGSVRDEMCRELARCSARVEGAAASMAELADAAEAITLELDALKNRGYSLSSQQRCQHCDASLFSSSQPFYAFPCSHAFHADCLLRMAPDTLPGAVVGAEGSSLLLHVQTVVEKMRALAPRAQHDADKRAQAQLELLQAELDGCIAADCPLCGYAAIHNIALPLIANTAADRAEALTWVL